VLYLYLNHLLRGQAYAYQSVLFRAACAILLAFFLVWWFGPVVIRTLVRLKVGDVPEFDNEDLNVRTRDKANTPTMGGILILGAIVASVLLLANLRNYYVLLAMFCLIWLGILGAIDDYLKLTAKRRGGSRDGLKMYEKLLFQIGLGVLLGYFIYYHGAVTAGHFATIGGPGGWGEASRQQLEAYHVLAVPFYKHGVFLGIYGFMITTVLVTAGTSNAVNLTDGMDGLAAGCMALCSFVFVVIAVLVGDVAQATRLLMPAVPGADELGVLCGAMVGACLGFLWYNCHPAQVFMGDTGSLPLGGLIGYVAIVTRQELMLFIVGGIFVIEAVSVILQVSYFKMSGGKRIFRIAPIHHHFHLGGWTETQTVMRFWLVSALFAAFALATVKLR
jgi:phospho-N-acetylmuramoyl-pentapeptide-transferase